MSPKAPKSPTGKSKVKVGKLKLNKETIKNLSKTEAKAVKGAGKTGRRTCPEICIVEATE